MLSIRDLCKTKGKIQLNHIDLTLEKGAQISLICNSDRSDLLVRLMMGVEVPAKGEVIIDGICIHQETHLQVHPNVGWVLNEVGFYDRMTVGAYLAFFKKILNSHQDVSSLMVALGLMDVSNLLISKLTNSQKRRLNLARESLKDLKLLVVQEPILNMDQYESKLIVSYLEALTQRNIGVLTICHAYKDAWILGGKLFTLDESGVKEIQNETNQDTSEKDLTFKIEKIPAKIDERILLFNPIEIDYIESESGSSYLNVRGERFACTLTLKELEHRLQHLGFFMCHRSYLVNLQKIKEIMTWSRNSYSLILDDQNQSAIPLSKNRIDQLKTRMNL